MILFALVWGHPVPPALIVIGLLLALLFTTVLVWLLRQNYSPELQEAVERPDPSWDKNGDCS